MGFNSWLPGMPADRCVNDAEGRATIQSGVSAYAAERRKKHGVLDLPQAKKSPISRSGPCTLYFLVDLSTENY
ncbi:hypothetical protein SAMN05444172_9311 [Burkholderia sp. GAS332]|nr:hypothetical protein SAMN05444172_9311 [Burkholderia sp. GAS332]